MSRFLTNAAIQEFDAEVKHQYQGLQTLRQCVSLRTGVTGDAYKFTRMGKGVAGQKASQADVTPMDIGHGRQTATLEDWLAPEYTDIFDKATVNFDEQQELAQTIAGALGRREDQLVIGAISGASYVASNDEDPETGRLYDFSASAPFNLAALIAAAEHLNDIEAPMEDRFMLIDAVGLSGLLNDEKLTSVDYNNVKSLINGDVDTFMGFKFKKIGTRAEGGIPPGSAWAWHKSAVGLAIGIDMQTTVDWVAHKTSWLANGFLKAGAVAREPQGLVQILYQTS